MTAIIFIILFTPHVTVFFGVTDHIDDIKHEILDNILKSCLLALKDKTCGTMTKEVIKVCQESYGGP